MTGRSIIRSRVTALVGIAACQGGHAERPAPLPPSLSPVEAGAICITRGDPTADGRPGLRFADPTVRAVARGSTGDAGAIRFRYRGPTDRQARLASGSARQQVGLKLLAEDGCNLVYVMWRVGPPSRVAVSIKRNGGDHTHEQCGAGGYTSVTPSLAAPPPPLMPGETHTLSAQIAGGQLIAWIDDRLVWRGRLGAGASGLSGPAGFRSDNIALDVELRVSPSARPGIADARRDCHPVRQLAADPRTFRPHPKENR